MKQLVFVVLIAVLLLAEVSPVVAYTCRECNPYGNCYYAQTGWYLCWRDKWGQCWTQDFCSSTLAPTDVYF